jgi:hypothetical protein
MKHLQKIDIYIETNYAGSIEITVERGNRISVIDKVRLDVLDKEPRSRTFYLPDDANHVR